MANLLEGRIISARIKEDLKKDILDLKSEFKINLKLSSIQVGDNPAVEAYIKSQKRVAEELGIEYQLCKFNKDISESELIEFIQKLNSDESVNGIIVQLPLPPQIDYKKISEFISSLKDVEGVNPANIGKLFIYDRTALIHRIIIDTSGNVGIGTTAPGAKLHVDGNIIGGRTAQAWSAKRTAALICDAGAAWADIPGLSITFTLTRPALVQMRASGVQRATTTTDWIHVGYRFVIDGTPRGHADHGQRLHVSHNSYALWNTWNHEDFVSLTAGTHTISIQARNSAGSITAIIGGEVGGTAPAYTECTLQVVAFYD